MTITLNGDEVILVEQIATNRHVYDKGAGIEDRLATDRDPIENAIEAFGAELAVCKHFNVYPDLQWTKMQNVDLVIPGRVNGSVVDLLIDVKMIPPGGAKMNVRKTRRHGSVDYYIGVSGKCPYYDILGTMSSERVSQYPLLQGRKETEYWSIPIADLGPIQVR